MKKVWAMGLAFAFMAVAVTNMVFMSALACDTSVALGYSVCMDNGADVLDTDEIADFGARVVGTTAVTITIPIKYAGFKYLDASGQSYVDYQTAGVNYTAIDSRVTGHMELKFTDTNTERIFRRPNFIPAGGGKEARIELVAENIGECKGYIYILFHHNDYTTTESEYYDVSGQFIDPTINKTITSLTGKNLTEVKVELNESEITDLSTLEDLNVAPDSELAFRLNTDFFEWDPQITHMNAVVRKSTLDKNRVDISTHFYKGHSYIDSIDIKNVDGVAYVVVEFLEYLADVDEQTFHFTICLTHQEKKDERTMVEVMGVIANEEINVDGYTYANIEDGLVATADENNKKIELYLGNGVSVVRGLNADKKYYGVALDERSNADVEVMEYYPSIRRVLNLKTVNMETSGNVVKINALGTEPDQQDLLPDNEGVDEGVTLYYIYDANGKYLGNTDEMLPFRDKYYLSTGIITMNVDLLEDINDESAGLDNPDTGAGARLSMVLTVVASLGLGALVLADRRTKIGGRAL